MQDLTLSLLLYLPNDIKKQERSVALFLGLNFFGNHTIHKDPAIAITKNWIPADSTTGGRKPAELRGLQSSSWPVEFILKHGYGLATIYCGDIAPDRNKPLDEDNLWLVARGEDGFSDEPWGTSVRGLGV